MLNLNGNIIRQLNQIYRFSFKIKYKEEIKERIIFFVSKIISDNQEIPILFHIKNISNMIIVNDNNLQKLTTNFFNKYKEELLTSFNPLWYDKEEKMIYTDKEKDEMFNSFIEKLSYEIDYQVDLSRIKNKRGLISAALNINSFKIKNRQNSIFKPDMSIIKSKYYFKLKKILKKINKKIEELLISTERFYFSDGIKNEDYIKGLKQYNKKICKPI